MVNAVVSVLTAAVAHPRQYLSLCYCLLLSLSPFLTRVFWDCVSTSIASCMNIFFFLLAFRPHYLTEVWHKPDRELWVVSSKEIARRPVSIGYNKLAGFGIVFSFHQPLLTKITCKNLQCNQESSCALTIHELQATCNVPKCQQTAILSSYSWVARTVVEWLNWMVVSDLI